MLRTLWRKYIDRASSAAVAGQRSPRRRRWMPSLETLEDRLTPSSSGARSDNEGPPPQDGGGGPKLPAFHAIVPIDHTTVQLEFNKKLGSNATKITSYSIPGLSIVQATVSPNSKVVQLSTEPQEINAPYEVSFVKLKLANGNRVKTPNPVPAIVGLPVNDGQLPRVVGAASTGHQSVLVSFSEPMDATVLNPQFFAVSPTSVNPEAAILGVTAVAFAGEDHTAVVLTTHPQNQIGYTLKVIGGRDLLGNPLAAPTIVGTDPTKATFTGTPPSFADLVDTDGDGLTDNDEYRGWTVVIKQINGTLLSRPVTSSPFAADTDGDGSPDALEAALRTDPRDPDSDDDQLTDYQEYFEIFCDHLNQDTDGDGVDDGTEFLGVTSNPVFADSDGDQIDDGYEIPTAIRNPLVADLPLPTIEVGNINLQLDVRFTETTSTETRELESRSVSSTLAQNESAEYTSSASQTIETFEKIAGGFDIEVAYKAKIGLLSEGTVSGKFTGSFSRETGSTNTFNHTSTEASREETQQAYQDSLAAETESTEGANVSREVMGARMQIAVFLNNASPTLAYTLKNLQVTAFIQDPQNPSELTPVATLTPDAEPVEGYTLGPLVPTRGPFIFTSETVYPSLVESLMKNPRGLIFQIANYDILSEDGRNFAFASTEVVERTAVVTIDYGGADSDGDGVSETSEIHRVSTSPGRIAIDTNGDGQVDENDRRVAFSIPGVHVGTTLRQSLNSLRLTAYSEYIDEMHKARLLAAGVTEDQIVNSAAELNQDELANSYSTYLDEDGVERFYRIRNTGLEAGVRKQWEIITPTGIDQTLDLDTYVLGTNTEVTLAFIQDIDNDAMPANLEFFLGTSDNLPDTDGDILDDRFETLIGWEVSVTGVGSYRVTSSGRSADSDGDGLTDAEEAPALLVRTDDRGLIKSATKAGPGDFVTDPFSSDTDGDGVSDFDEVRGYNIRLLSGLDIKVFTDPTNPDTDGDTAEDGLEARLGGNPTDMGDRNLFSDDDGDGLVNIQETDGWEVTVYLVSTVGFQEGASISVHVTSNPNVADSDGDGIADGEEYDLLIHPNLADTDGDGLTDKQEVRGVSVRDLGILLLDPNDADTDDDKRSDGAEAELKDVEVNRWVVRVTGAVPYQVYSNPLVADCDFDKLVDGDEFAAGSDPTKGNTDGDRRSDYQDVVAGLSAVQEDFNVTILFTSIGFEENGDNGNDAGDIGFDFVVRKPDDTVATGLSNTLTHILSTSALYDGPFQYHYAPILGVEAYLPPPANPNDPTEQLTSTNFNGIPFGDGVLVNNKSELIFAAYAVPDSMRSISFNMTKDQRFSLEGVIAEYDGPGGSQPTTTRAEWATVFLGGLEGLPVTFADGSKSIGVFDGSDLINQSIVFMTFNFNENDNVGVGIDETSADRIRGLVKLLYIVH